MADPTAVPARLSRLRMFLVTAIWLFSTNVPGQAQVPVTHSVHTIGLAPGETAQLTVYGEQLQNACWLWTPVSLFAPQEGHDPASDKQVVFSGVLADDAQVGIHPARIVTAGGCSESASVIVDSVAVTAAASDSESRNTPQQVSFPCAVQGTMNAVKPRYLRIALSDGQAVCIQAFARQLNSDLDPVITVFDSNGQEIAFCDDVPGLEGDARVSFVAPSDGNYLVELRDVRYSGGSRHFFHLRIADSPLNAWPTRSMDNKTAFAESEPNDDGDSANTVDIQYQQLHGTLSADGDADWFRLTTAQETPFCITANTRTINSPADLVLRLFDAEGKLLKEADETGALDAQVHSVLPAGEFLLQATDVGSDGGAEWYYELTLERRGRVEVVLVADHLNVPRGGSASLTAAIRRMNYDGPVTLQIEGLAEGIHYDPITLNKNQTTVPLTFTTESDFTNAGCDHWNPATLVISVPTDEQIFSAVSVAPPERKKNGGPFRTSRGVSSFFCAAAAEAEFSLRVDTSVVTIPAGTSGNIVVEASRHADWSAPIELALAVPAVQLPKGIKVPAARIEGEQGSFTVEIAADAAPQQFTLFLQGTAKKDKATATHPVPPLRIQIVPGKPEDTETEQ
jgi:hypothetical protein